AVQDVARVALVPDLARGTAGAGRVVRPGEVRHDQRTAERVDGGRDDLPATGVDEQVRRVHHDAGRGADGRLGLGHLGVERRADVAQGGGGARVRQDERGAAVRDGAGVGQRRGQDELVGRGVVVAGQLVEHEAVKREVRAGAVE